MLELIPLGASESPINSLPCCCLTFSQWPSFHHRKGHKWRSSVGVVLSFHDSSFKGSICPCHPPSPTSSCSSSPFTHHCLVILVFQHLKYALFCLRAPIIATRNALPLAVCKSGYFSTFTSQFKYYLHRQALHRSLFTLHNTPLVLNIIALSSISTKYLFTFCLSSPTSL